jgi:hypothetical protein
MEQYIPKSTLITEIKQILHKYEKEYEKLTHYEIWITAKEIEPKIKQLKNLLSFIDTLEIKEVDLEEKANKLSQKYFPDEENIWGRSNIEAKKCKSACIEMIEWFNTQKGE